MAYNGWSNYETWNVPLWLSNDEGTWDYWCEATAAAWAEAEGDRPEYFSRSEQARYRLADRLKEEVTDAQPEAVQGTMWADLLGAALDNVDWQEIADNWLSDSDTAPGYEPRPEVPA